MEEVCIVCRSMHHLQLKVSTRQFQFNFFLHIVFLKCLFAPLLNILSVFCSSHPNLSVNRYFDCFNTFQYQNEPPSSSQCRFLLQCISQAGGKASWLCGYQPVLICYCSLKCWAVSRSQVRQFVLLTTQWTCFIGTLLEVSSKWRAELWGSGLLPSFSWRVNYTVGGAGGLSQGWGLRL